MPQHQLSPPPPNHNSINKEPQPKPHTDPPTSSPTNQPVESQQDQEEQHISQESADQISILEFPEELGDPVSEEPSETPVTKSGSDPISCSETRKVSCEDIQLVQNLIERCLQLYMSQDEVIKTLLNQARIEPGFTSLVWQKLEEQNNDFFTAYYARLKLKNQIILFNHLLEQQYQFMKMQMPPKFPLAPIHNAHHLPMGYPVLPQPSLIATGHPHMVPMTCGTSGIPVVNGASFQENFISSQGSPGTDNLTDISMEVPPVVQSPCTAISTMNDMSLSPTSVMSSSPFPFNPTDMSGMGMSMDGNLSSGDAPGPSGIGALNMVTDGENGGVRDSLKSLCQLPRNFSLSDLTADLTHGDLGPLGSYSGSPFLTPETEAFFRSPDKDELDEEKMLESIIEPYSDEGNEG
ncbi:hypothetical protein SUGI_0789170 [Cryptomeria japonica]|uniref:uncharacterized protein LOC131047043 n=1 Tax=Cryptomeria japonica TaxID=3369 RepID=UPI002414888C|nr:uncharacterized protein LOC131047043 [Cryptomeria japonica]XP_057836826.1 uncharacterized protein LOC131047043 [Cryptomeria japonica]XP_057836827.1 uncharacterized protein LOC131047043 [Cryptomeria japonica]XP_057836828.1 uncharacterized protein LOC131047043 [Cryptomeria japonica]XP_057836829.1 uncharacterized protein LOC131047043 [Cryptomeria japonica]XP_057836830.1 uncharacterized protein LOC131047043 [Cryptomeria japonica]GLJ38721.1 hypothetical protein SUGI_0789170 [Cryptomeria japonic